MNLWNLIVLPALALGLVAVGTGVFLTGGNSLLGQAAFGTAALLLQMAATGLGDDAQ